MPEKTYEMAWIAVNTVILTLHENKLKVLLARREKAPYKNRLELYGGLLKEGETAEEALKRKLGELLGNQEIFFQQFFSFTNPSRDPRERAISIGYIALLSPEKAKAIEGWVDCKTLPELAFDHNEIIAKAVEHLKENPNSDLIRHFMPLAFPLNLLQEAYEIIEGKTYDNRNFRRQMVYSGIVEETGKSEKGVSHRPAKLFRFKS